MKVSWSLLFLIMAVLAVVGVGCMYYWYTGKSSKKEIKIEKIDYEYKNYSSDKLGRKWGDFSELGKDGFEGFLFVRVVSSGQVIRKDLPIKTKEGNVLATAVVSFSGSFYDKDGVKQTVIVPMLVRLKGNRLFHPSYNGAVDWGDKEIATAIEVNPPLFGAWAGLVERLGVLVLRDDQKYNSAIKDATRSEYLSVIFEYNNSWKEELDAFASTGVVGFDMLLPFSLSIGRQVIVVEDF